MPVRRRPMRRLALLAALVALTVTLAGCEKIEAAVRTTDALRDAGYKDPVITIEKDERAQTVTVDYASDARNLDSLRAEENRVARVVWQTMRYRMDVIRVAPTSDLLGEVPSRRYPRSVLVDLFGRRPGRLDRPVASRPFQFGVIATVALLVLLFGLLIAGVILFVRSRSRRANVPPWLADPGYPGWSGPLPPPGGGPGRPEPAPRAPPVTPAGPSQARPAPARPTGSLPQDDEGSAERWKAPDDEPEQDADDDGEQRPEPPLGGAWRRS